MRHLLLILLFFITPYALSADTTTTNTKQKSENKVVQSSIPVHIGLPNWMGGNGQLYIDISEAREQLSADPMSPMEYLIYKMGKFFTWLAIAAVIGMILGGICIYVNKTYLAGLIPFGKDIIAVSGIILLGSVGAIWFLNYVYWIAGILVFCVACYLAWAGYRMYKTYHDKIKTEKVVQTKDKVIEELVKTGEVLKTATTWGDKEINAVKSIQSDVTESHVNMVQDKLKLQPVPDKK